MTARTGFPRFTGAFKEFSISQFTNRETGTDRRLHVFSQGSRAKVSEFLWLKYLWDELTRMEFQLFIAMPETLNSTIKVAALRAVLLYGKRRIRTKLCQASFLPEKERPTRLRYQGFKRLDVEINVIERSLPKVPKFKGWIKSSSAKDSKSYRGPRLLEPLAITEHDYDSIVFDWYSYLTVDEFLPLPGKYCPHPDENQKFETVNPSFIFQSLDVLVPSPER